VVHDGRGGWERDGWKGGGAAVVVAVVGGVIFLFVAVPILLVVGFALGGFDFNLQFGPGKGTASVHLPVSVTPTSALHEGSVVRVRSSAFHAGQVVGVAVCLTTADTERRGVDACDTKTASRYAVTDDRRLDATYTVPRAIAVDGEQHDCAAQPGTCMVVAASISDYDQSGGRQVTFARPIGPPRPPPKARPASDWLPIVAWGRGPFMTAERLTVTARGFQPNEPVLVAMCGRTFILAGDLFSCRPENSAAAAMAISGGDVSEVHDFADASGTFTASVDVPPTVAMTGTPGTRCSTAPGSCSVVIAAAADTKRSAMLPLTVVR
jgi:hypothetical protein